MVNFVRQIQSIVALPPDLVEFFYTRLTIKQVQKRQQLLRVGQLCDCIYYVKSGLFRSCAKPGNREITNWFMKENDIFTVPLSFYGREPSVEKLQALEDSVVVCLHHQDLQTIYNEYPFFNLAGRMVTEQYMAVLSKYNYISRIKPSGLRYHYFTTAFPDLVGRVPDRDIASYLGLTDGYLSKLKSKKGSG